MGTILLQMEHELAGEGRSQAPVYLPDMVAMRYGAAFVILLYGFAKINGAQFTILDSELDKPMGEVSGFWLTWYYFGYSRVYGTLVAGLQIGGALLLTFPRTALLGACILAPLLANIAIINVCFGIDPAATVVAVLLLATMAAVIRQHWRELAAVFWPAQSARAGSLQVASAKWVARIALVAVSFGSTYWVANYNNRLPTPLDGGWDVVEVAPASAAVFLPKAIFFEYNRASMVVFKSGRGTYETHHFEVDRRQGRLWMWDKWLHKGSSLFSGVYTLKSPELSFSGDFHQIGPVRVRLHKRPAR